MKIETEYPTASTERTCDSEDCATGVVLPGERYAWVGVTSDEGRPSERRYCRRCWPSRAFSLMAIAGASDLLQVPADGA